VADEDDHHGRADALEDARQSLPHLERVLPWDAEVVHVGGDAVPVQHGVELLGKRVARRQEGAVDVRVADAGDPQAPVVADHARTREEIGRDGRGDPEPGFDERERHRQAGEHERRPHERFTQDTHVTRDGRSHRPA
jgi:hypothetical protein